MKMTNSLLFFDKKTQLSPNDSQLYLKKKTKIEVKTRGATSFLNHGIVQPPPHMDSRRMHPTTQLHKPNSHARGTPESKRCSWSNPLPREGPGSCVWVLAVCRQTLGRSLAPPSQNISPQAPPDPLVSCIGTAWLYPTDICWLWWRTSPAAAPRTTPPTVRLRTGHPMFLLALISHNQIILHPFSLKKNPLAIKKTKKKNWVFGISTAVFCCLTNEARLFFSSAFHFLFSFFIFIFYLLVKTGPNFI